MTLIEIISLMVALFVGLGLIITWQRNGRHQAERDIAQAEIIASWKQEIKDDIGHIQDDISSPTYGLGALSKGIADFKTHCATVSTAIEGAVKTNTKDIKELKDKVSKGRR